MLSIVLSILSGCLLGIPFLEPGYYFLSWVAFVPLLIAIEYKSLVITYALGLVTGLIMAVNIGYWIIPYLEIAHQITGMQSIVLAVLFWLYSAQQVALPILLYQWLSKQYRVQPQLLFPALIGLINWVFPNLFPIDPAQSQGLFTVAIQAIDLFGVLGLNLIMALCNVIIYQVIRFRLMNTSLAQSWPAVFILMWFLYGFISISKWKEPELGKASPDPTKTMALGLVQPNELPRWEPKRQYPGYGMTFPPELEMTQLLVKAGAELVIWPEGIAKGYLDNSAVKIAYRKYVSNLNTPLIFQDMQSKRLRLSNKTISRKNIMVFLDEKGIEAANYQKIMRVPFGEYIPVIGEILSDSDLLDFTNYLERLFSSKFEFISAGEKFVHFKINELDIIPLICYETTNAAFVAQALREYFSKSAVENQQATILVALSNDGWFESPYLSKHHVTSSILRAVENRIPLVHVSNNGPSMIIASSGEVLSKTPQSIAGGYIVELPYLKKISPTVYNLYPWVSPLMLGFLYLSILMVFFSRRGINVWKVNKSKIFND